jgi:hypothetical protein
MRDMTAATYTARVTFCRWHGPCPVATFDTFEDAKQWILSHYSEAYKAEAPPLEHTIDPVPED